MRKLVFTQQLLREGEAIVAYCPELDVSSCGDTEGEARRNLRVALRLFLEEAAQIGTLRDILVEAGYDVTEQVLASPTFSIEEQELTLSEEVAQCLV